ncbi:hypothetical protein [Litchfieldia salsa]|uniref:Uncharacterized protein n=1 Tax=Litchfieldia salsa TaxID=930152 RepID=A0A1H0S3D9_9BACI|nr:hypothetical protein [Litchfieldia salsa]SDP36177.1 hypothetical protein SAMN05216565_102520 [Litchfieldia salsa]
MAKRKPKEIHVDKIIIHAGEVIIVDDSKKDGRWDPWLGRVQQDDVDVDVEVNAVAGDDVEVDVDVDVDSDDTPPRRPFSWI